MTAAIDDFSTLDHESGSFVCSSPSGKVIELFEEGNARALHKLGWKVEITSVYLARINRESKETTQ